MPNYLVEAYVGRLTAAQLGRVTSRARTTAAAIAEPNGPVRYLGGISIPDDELCFHLYAGPSADAVNEAAARAGITADRIVEAVQLDWGVEADSSGDEPA